MKRKLFCLLTLLLTVCSGAWAQDWSINTTSAATSAWAGTYLDGAIVLTFNTGDSGTKYEDSGDYILGNGSGTNCSKNYIQITTTSEIDKVSFLISSNKGTANAIQPVVLAWGESTEGNPLAAFTNDAESLIGDYSHASWMEYDLSSGSYKNIRIARKASARVGSASSTSEYGNGQSCRVWGVKVWLKVSCESVAAPTSLTCTAHTKNSLTFGWTAAANASSYDVTLYDDAECTSQVATDNVTVLTKTFTGLNATKTYYCKVQSKGNGTTYCEEGNVTDAASGTTDDKDYTVTVTSNNALWGTAEAEAGTLDAAETTEVNATANIGFKFANWAVTGTGASLSSTTDNPTTLTMGTANATVTATFRALESYTISYAAGSGDGIEGSKADETKTEDEAFTLPATAVFTRTGYVQTGWSTTDGGAKDYELGGSYTTNSAQTFYPFWTAAYTLTYDANGGSGSMSNTQGVGEVTLTANAFTKDGYSFVGWATSQANADAGVVAYANEGTYTLNATAIIYAVWEDNYFEFTPKVVSENENVNKTVGTIISNSTGGVMTNTQTDTNDGRLVYTSNGLKFASSSNSKVTIILNDYMKEGTMICATFWDNSNKDNRGVDILNAAGTDKGDWYFTSTSEGTTKSFTFTATEANGFAGTKSFSLKRKGDAYLKSLTVVKAQPGAEISVTGWNTYSSNKALDLSTISGGEAFYAKSTSGSSVVLSPATGVVPAGEGLMIKGSAGATFTIDVAATDGTAIDGNKLVGMPSGGTVAKSTTGSYNYVYGWQTEDPENTFGFYYLNSHDATLGAGKAYLHLTEAIPSEGRIGIIFDDEETTGINAALMNNERMNNEVYNLNGQRVAQPTKGLYIVNGRKVVIK